MKKSKLLFFSILVSLAGFLLGFDTVIISGAPANVSDIAPAKDTGKLVAMYPFNIVFGILMAYISNFFLKDIGTDSWRFMVGIEAVPAIIYALLVIKIPESPRWLIEH